MSDADCLSPSPLFRSGTDARTALVLGTDDTVIPLGDAPAGRAGERHTLVAVVHRRFGVWTHLYRVTRTAAPRSTLVHLLRVAEGDHAATVSQWSPALRSTSVPAV